MEHIFTVTGMTCGHCEKAVTQAIKSVDPQAQVTIERQANRVSVVSNENPQALAAAVAEEGYAITTPD